MNTDGAEAGQGVGPMAVNKIVHPGIEDREARAAGPASRRRHRVTRDGALLRAAPTRSPCWRGRTPPASRTWYRSGAAG